MHDEAEAPTEPVDVTPEEVSETGISPTPEPTATEPAPAEPPQPPAEETSLPVDEVFAWHREKEAALSSWEETPGEATESVDPEPGLEPVGEAEEEAESGGEGAGEPVESAEGDPDREPEAGEENKQFRLRPQNALEERVFELIKNHREQSLTLEDALAQARAEQEVSEGETRPETGSGGEGDEAMTESNPGGDGLEGLDFLSAAELAGEISRQRAENLEVLKQNLDVSVYAEGESKVFQLEQAHEAAVRREAAEAEAHALAQRRQAKSRTAALEKYPDLQDGESRFAARHAEVLAAWETMRDSRAGDGDAPMLVADLVARELGISPASSSGGEDEPSVSPPTPTQPSSTPKPSSRVPDAQVSAGLRAATPPRPQSQAAVPRRTQAAVSVAPSSGAQRTLSHQPRVAAALDAVRTPEDYERIKQTFST